MNHSMMSSLAMVVGQRVAAVALASTLAATAVSAQGATVGADSWRLGASVGVLAPRSAVVMAATGGEDSRLDAASSFSLDLQYIYSPNIALYGNGLVSFTNLSRGTMVRAVGPSNAVTMLGGTAGLMLSPALFGETLRPTLRLGGGYKGYQFDMGDAGSSFRPTGDIGIGFRAGGSGPIEASVEMRYLPSSFDQGKLPLRSVVPQAQRQTDLLFGIGVSIRP